MYHTSSQIGETWWDSYWRMSYKIIDVSAPRHVTVRWSDGKTTTHATKISKGDYRQSEGK